MTTPHEKSLDLRMIKNHIWTALYRQGYDVRIEYSVPEISTRLEDYVDRYFYKYLNNIYKFLLKKNTGKKNGRLGHFGILADCDIFLACSNQVIELDELRHFNTVRRKVLEMYPDNLPLAFDREVYIQKCEGRINKVKPSHIWYEVIRDFLPWIAGINPTARIDLSSLPRDITELDYKKTLAYLKKKDRKLTFYKKKTGTIKLRRKNNVDEEKNFVFRKLLDRYANVYWEYLLPIPATLEAYKGNQKIHSSLKKVFTKLENHRGRTFRIRKSLAACDIYVPEEKIIVELDERQHFTELRAVSLENYPKALDIGFDRNEYINFCRNINAKDNDPPSRDEQRAWYDAVRDFIPLYDSSYRPVVRIPLFQSSKVDFLLDHDLILKRLSAII